MDRAPFGDSVNSVHFRQKNVQADQLSCPDPVLPTEWSLLPRVFEVVWEVFICPCLDMFATRANTKLPLYMSPVPDPMVWKQGAFQHSWDDLTSYAVSLSLSFGRSYRVFCFQQGSPWSWWLHAGLKKSGSPISSFLSFRKCGICWFNSTCGSFIAI